MSKPGPGPGQGRGRGEAPALLDLEEQQRTRAPARGGARPGDIPVLEPERSGSSTGSSDGEKTVRGRGGFKPKETRDLYTIPPDVTSVRVEKGSGQGQPCELLSNFVKISPMAKKDVVKYRIDFEPNLESLPMRRAMFKLVTPEIFQNHGADFDGVSDARSTLKTKDKVVTKILKHPVDDSNVTMTIKQVGVVAWASQEMIRLYNMNMKTFLRLMGFFQVSKIGAYVHPELSKPIGTSNAISMMGGFKTACNVHEEGQILMNLESAHKLMQRGNVLSFMNDLRERGAPLPVVKENLVGKLVVTSYNKEIYKIEDVNFELNANSKFKDHKTGNDITYCEYYAKRYEIKIKVAGQPLLLGVPNARNLRKGEENKEIYLVPELCNIAGLTDQQRNDMRLKTDLIRASQVSPQDVVANLRTFLTQLHNNQQVKEILNKWSYNCERDLVGIKGRILPLQKIGAGRASTQAHANWPSCDASGGFEQIIMRETLAKVPTFSKMYVLMCREDAKNEGALIARLRGGFSKVGLRPESVKVDKMMEGDSAHMYCNYLRRIPNDTTAAIVILPRQNKERYDAVKKLCAVERGIVTQVVTTRLMMDERKAGGASTKIAIQIAAKIGGEPWYNHMPLQSLMICGYDTYHDTAKRGRSYGAFLASMNQQRSRWWSKADSHEHIDELSSHVAENMTLAMQRFKKVNDKWPERVVLYRDGVGDGQIPHVFEVELDQIKKSIHDCNDQCKLTFIIVNKRIGARFFMKNNNTFVNPPPGSVVDDIVTRKSRYDFYLISQSTRHGTVSPTYYNIIYDTSGLEPHVHQLMAYKMCFLYYNWTGTVRVPAPCQYAHKLALLCGEHLHAVPNSNLDDKLHFL